MHDMASPDADFHSPFHVVEDLDSPAGTAHMGQHSHHAAQQTQHQHAHSSSMTNELRFHQYNNENLAPSAHDSQALAGLGLEQQLAGASWSSAHQLKGQPPFDKSAQMPSKSGRIPLSDVTGILNKTVRALFELCLVSQWFRPAGLQALTLRLSIVCRFLETSSCPGNRTRVAPKAGSLQVRLLGVESRAPFVLAGKS